MDDPQPCSSNTGESEDTGVPSELKETLAQFDASLSNVEKTIQPWLDVPESELNEELLALDKAKLELVGAYTINSMFWMYLNVCGVNPKEHPVKQELDRIRSYMNRVKDIQDKAKAAKVDKSAAKRFIKHALWQQAKGKQKPEEKDQTTDDAGDGHNAPEAKSHKRKLLERPTYSDEDTHSGTPTQKPKKKKKSKKKDN